MNNYFSKKVLFPKIYSVFNTFLTGTKYPTLKLKGGQIYFDSRSVHNWMAPRQDSMAEGPGGGKVAHVMVVRRQRRSREEPDREVDPFKSAHSDPLFQSDHAAKQLSYVHPSSSGHFSKALPMNP